MKNYFFIFLFVYCLLSTAISFGQNKKNDSLILLLRTDKLDTNKLNHLNQLSRQFMYIDNEDSTMYYGNCALNLSNIILEENKNPKIRKAALKGKADSYNHIGIAYDIGSKFPEALKNYSVALQLRTQIGDLKGQAASTNNIGLVYEHQGNYSEALKYHLASLKIEETIGNKEGMAESYANIGNIYADQSNFKEALKNHFEALKIDTANHYKRGTANTYNNIGLNYSYLKNFSEALKYHFASIKIKEELGDKSGVATTRNNIGLVYYEQARKEKDPTIRNKKWGLAMKNYYEALRLQDSMHSIPGMGNSYNNIANVYIKQKKFKEAEKCLLTAKELLTKIGYREYLRGTYKALVCLDSARGNYKGAYENHKLYILYRDSLDNEETRKKTIQSQMTYDFEKKEAVADAEHKKELENQEALAEEKSRKQKIVLFLVLGSLFLVLIFAGFISRSLRVTRKQKNIIELQKNLVETQKYEVEQQKLLVEEHQKEIIDSITYARRIQRALLPTEKYIDKSLKRLKIVSNKQ